MDSGARPIWVINPNFDTFDCMKLGRCLYLSEHLNLSSGENTACCRDSTRGILQLCVFRWLLSCCGCIFTAPSVCASWWEVGRAERLRRACISALFRFLLWHSTHSSRIYVSCMEKGQGIRTKESGTDERDKGVMEIMVSTCLHPWLLSHPCNSNDLLQEIISSGVMDQYKERTKSILHKEIKRTDYIFYYY